MKNMKLFALTVLLSLLPWQLLLGQNDSPADTSDNTVLPSEPEEDKLIFRGLGGVIVRLDNTLIPPVWLQQKIEQRDSTAILGYNIYRREAGLTWKKLNPQPVRMKDKEAFKARFGNDIFERMVQDSSIKQIAQLSKQSVTFSKMSDEEKAWSFLSVNTAPEEVGLIGLASEFYPYLGVAFVDSTVMEGIQYEYRIVPVTLGGEQQPKDAGSIIYSTVPTTKSPIDYIKAEFKREVVKGEIAYFPRPDMSYVVIYRLEDGAEPVLIERVTADFRGKTSRQFVPFYDSTGQTGKMYRYRAYAADFWWNYSIAKESDEIFAFDIYEDYYVSSATITDIGEDGIELSWASDKQLSVYKEMIVYRSTEAEGNYTAVDTLPFSAMRWRDTTIKPLQTLYYKLQRVYINGDTGSFSPYFLHTYEVLVPPPVPENIAIVPDKKGISLTWEKPKSKIPMLGYYIMRAYEEDGHYHVLQHVDSATFTFVDTMKYSPYRKLFYRINAMNISRVNGDSSLPIMVQTYHDSLELLPKGVWNVYVDDDNSVTVSLSDYAKMFPYIEGMNVYRYKEGDTLGEKLNGSPIKEPIFHDKTASIGNKYTYRYSLVDIRGVESILSATKNVAVEKIRRYIPRVDGVKLRYQTEGVELTWQAIESNLLSRYVILRSEDGFSYEAIGNTTEPRFFDPLPKGMRVYYKIVAFFDEDEGEPSIQITAIR